MTPTELQEKVGRSLHESWCRTMRAQLFHGAMDVCTENARDHAGCRAWEDERGIVRHHECHKFNPDLVPWEVLPEPQQNIHRHVAAAVLDSGLLVDAELAHEREEAISSDYAEDLRTAKAEVTRLREVVRITEIEDGKLFCAEQEAKESFQHERDEYYDLWRAAESRLARTQEALCQIEGALNDNFAKPEYETLGRVREIIDATLALPAETTPEVSCTCPGRRVPQHLPNCPLGAETKGTRKP